MPPLPISNRLKDLVTICIVRRQRTLFDHQDMKFNIRNFTIYWQGSDGAVGPWAAGHTPGLVRSPPAQTPPPGLSRLIRIMMIIITIIMIIVIIFVDIKISIDECHDTTVRITA